MMTLRLLAAVSLWEVGGETRGQETVCVLYDACLRCCVHSDVSWLRWVHIYTGRFIMFSVITNTYNKKTKEPTLMELFTATGNLNKFFFFFLTTGNVRWVHHGWHGTHRYDIQVLATHASTWVHHYSSLLQWSVTLSQRGHVATVLCVLCTVTTDLLVWYFKTQNDFSPGAAIFSLHTLTSPSDRNVKYDEKQLSGEKIWVVPSMCTGFVSTWPTVFL